MLVEIMCTVRAACTGDKGILGRPEGRVGRVIKTEAPRYQKTPRQGIRPMTNADAIAKRVGGDCRGRTRASQTKVPGNNTLNSLKKIWEAG